MVADELSDAYGELEQIRHDHDDLKKNMPGSDDNAAAEIMDNLASRIESIAAKLEEA